MLVTSVDQRIRDCYWLISEPWWFYELAGLSLSALFGLLILLGVIPVSTDRLIAMTGNPQPSEHLCQLPQKLGKTTCREK